jgi:L-malate glycosyltransferase
MACLTPAADLRFMVGVEDLLRLPSGGTPHSGTPEIQRAIIAGWLGLKMRMKRVKRDSFTKGRPMRNDAGRIRVFHLIKSLGRGGAEMLLSEGLRFADRERFEYSYGYFLPWKDAMVSALEEQGAEVRCFGGSNNVQILLAAHRVAAHLRRSRADVLHCHLPIAGTVGRIAGRLTGIPVVYSEHNKQERYHWLTRRLNAATWRWQACAIAVSADVADSIRAHISSEVPLRVVLNGVDVDRFDRSSVDGAPIREQFGIPAEAPVVGTVAVFRAQKRLLDWVEAARLLRERFPAVHFLLVGDGPLREDVVAAVARAGLQDVVHLPGIREEVRPFLAATDIYMMSSIFEGLPVALLEAMAMKCVPVCTGVGGIPELIRDGENGLLTEPEKPEQLAEAVGDLLADPKRIASLGAAARSTVEAGFSMQRMARELEDVYLAVTGHGHMRYGQRLAAGDASSD